MNKYLIWWENGEVQGIAAGEKPEAIEFPGNGSPETEIVEDQKIEKILDYFMEYVKRRDLGNRK